MSDSPGVTPTRPEGPPIDPDVRAPSALAMAVALVLIALNLRPALAGVGPVLAELMRDTGASPTLASILTTAPVLCLGVFGLAAPRLAARFGIERAILVGLVVLAAGTLMRIVPTFPSQLASGIVAGAGIGIVGVLLPAIVKRDFPAHASLVTGVYTMALCAGAAGTAGAMVPLERMLGGWAPALAVWAVPVIVAAAVWWPLMPRRRLGGALAPHRESGLWGDPLAWQVTLFMGLQSSLAFIVFAWFAPMLRDRGLDPASAGLVVSVALLVQVAGALGAPILAGRWRRQSWLGIGTLTLTIVGFLGALYAPIGGVWFWASLLGVGLGGHFGVALMLLVLRSRDPAVAASLSGMAQSVGYTIAAAGPFAVGFLLDVTGGWDAVAVLYTGIGIASAAFVALAGRDLQVGATGAPASVQAAEAKSAR